MRAIITNVSPDYSHFHWPETPPDVAPKWATLILFLLSSENVVESSWVAGSPLSSKCCSLPHDNAFHTEFIQTEEVLSHKIKELKVLRSRHLGNIWQSEVEVCFFIAELSRTSNLLSALSASQLCLSRWVGRKVSCPQLFQAQTLWSS